MLRILHANQKFVVAIVLRDRLTLVDVWFGFQVDGNFSLKMLNWPQSGAVKRGFRGSISLWVINACHVYHISCAQKQQPRRSPCSTHQYTISTIFAV